MTVYFCNLEGWQENKDLATLSGGEKSYVQMCLILTINV